jgi:glycosyltransferase involved in cell wall biosynthesis
MDFLVHTAEPAAYDQEIESRASRIFRVTASHRSPLYGNEISRILSRQGPFDAVHSHVHYFSGFLLWLASRAGVPVRIAHSHSDTTRHFRRCNPLREVYLRAAQAAMRRFATDLVAASRAAGCALFGDNWDADPRHCLLHCGIDLSSIARAADRESVRKSLGIQPSDFVIGHTGRFCTPKNHGFLIEVAAEAARFRRDLRLLLVGDGPDRPEIEWRVQTLGLRDRTIFTGTRSDVPDLLQAMDVFLFPSLWEGLPLTVLEAQAAGLPCVISDVISDETDVISSLIRRVSLQAPVGEWSRAVLAAAEIPRRTRPTVVPILEKTSFNIHRSIEQLYAIYCA